MRIRERQKLFVCKVKFGDHFQLREIGERDISEINVNLLCFEWPVTCTDGMDQSCTWYSPYSTPPAHLETPASCLS